MTDRSAIGAPKLEIINPDATPDEIAAIVAVLAALQAPVEPPTRKRSTWASYARRTRPPLHPGRGAWRASGLPR
jgi:hypothetical protein